MNEILTTDLVANYTLAEWSAYPLFIHTANRDCEIEWDGGAYKYGDTVNIRRRNRALIEDGPTGVASLRDIIEESEALQINHWYKDYFSFTNRSLTLEVDKFHDRYILPTSNTMAIRQDTDVAESAEYELNYYIGTAGAPLNSYASLSEITARMEQIGLQGESETYLAVTSNDAATMRAAFSNYFNDSLNSSIIKRARLGRIDMLDIVTSTAIKRHIAGTPGAGPITISSNVGEGNLLPMAGLTPSTLVFRRGDVFSVSGVKAINPIRQAAADFDMQFLVTADTVSNGDGNAVVPISCGGTNPIISNQSNANFNVSNVIQSGSIVTTVGDHNVNICYIPRGLSLVAPPMEPLMTPQSSVVSDNETNASIRLSIAGDTTNGVNAYRFEMLSGNKWHPQYAIRVIS